MNQQPSPYQPPLSQGPASFPVQVLGMPPEVRVLGILHLVFAGYGVLGVAWGLFITMVGNPFLKFLPANLQFAEQMESQTAMQERMMPMTITSSVFTLLVAIPMIIAGIKLLTKKKSALKWSNIYACSSIGAKLINLILAITIVIPEMQGMMKNTPGGDVMSGVMAAATGVGSLIPCIYPVLTLVLLNRAGPKAWFASLDR